MIPTTDMRFCGEPTADGDTAAEYMRAWYEAHRETDRDRKGKPWELGLADNFILGLMNEAARIEAECRRQVAALRAEARGRGAGANEPPHRLSTLRRMVDRKLTDVRRRKAVGAPSGTGCTAEPEPSGLGPSGEHPSRIERAARSAWEYQCDGLDPDRPDAAETWETTNESARNLWRTLAKVMLKAADGGYDGR